MKTSCVLTEGDVKNLYIVASAGMNEALNKGEEFDPQALMQRIFDRYDKKNDPITGALFVQQLPTIIGTIAIKPSMRGLKLKKGVSLMELRDDYLDPEAGIDNVLKQFKPLADPKNLKNLVEIQKDVQLNNPNEPKTTQRADVRLAAYSPFGLTMQMFKARKPSEKEEFEVEQLEPTKDRIYNALYNIKKAIPDGFNAMTDLIFEGRNLVLQPTILTGLPQNNLDAYAVDRIKRSATFRKTGKGQKGVTEANEMIAMVLVDKDTNRFVLFDEDGRVTDDTENGKIVYQFLRDTRIENGKYRVTDIYGIDDQVISPEQIVKNKIAAAEVSVEEYEAQLLRDTGKTLDELIAETEAEQQAQFKILYDIKEEVLKGTRNYFNISGVSEGLNIGYVTKTIPLNKLTEIPGVSNDVYQTINIIKSPRDGFSASQAVVTINDREFPVNRPNMDKPLMDKIIDVLLNPKLTDSQKYTYINQFSANLDYQVQRHAVYFDKAKSKLTFYYRPYTHYKATTENLKNEPIPLVLESAEAKDILENVFTYAYRENGEYKMSKLKFEPKLNGKTFSDYDRTTGKFIRANYTDFIKQFPAEVKFSPENKLGVYNSYMMFRPNTPFSDQLTRAKDAVTATQPVVEPVGEVKVEEEGEVTSTLTFGETETPSVDKAVKSEPDVLPTSTDDFVIRESVNFPVAPSIEEGIQPKDTKGPESTDTPVGNIFNRFSWDRSLKLPNNVTKEQIEEAMKWWESSPLSKFIKITQIANLVNSDSFANFIISGATLADVSINIDEKAGGTMADVYHEAWHAFSQLFLTKEEKTKLYNEIKNFKDSKGNQPNIDKTFFELEEMLAEDFRSYVLNEKPGKGTPVKNNLFRRIWNFIKSLFSKAIKREDVAGDVTLIPAVKELYDKLYLASENSTELTKDAFINKYKPNVDNAMFSMLDRGINSVDGLKSEVLNFQDSAVLVNSIDSIISQIIDNAYADGIALAQQQNDDKVVSKAGAVKILTDQRNKKVAYEMVMEELQERLKQINKRIEEIKDNEELKYETEQLEDAKRIISIGLENFGDETKGLVKYHIENSTFDIVRQKYIEIEYAEDENKTVAEEAQTSERYGDKIVNQKSLQELASKETVYILKSLFKKEGKNFVYNKLGFKELADFTTTWNNVTRTIGGIKDRREMYEKLKLAANTFPELQQLIDYKLPDPSKLLDRSEFKISSAFWQDFKKPRVTYIQLTAFKEGKTYELEVTEASIETSSVIRKFQNKFKADTKNPYATRVNNINALNLQKIAQTFGRKDGKSFDSSKSFEFARAIGLYLDDLTIIKNELNKNKDYYSLQYLYQAVKKLAELEEQSNNDKSKVTREQLKVIGEFKLDPLAVLKKGIPAKVISDEPFKQKNIIERFAELQGKYGADSSNFSVLNAERNLVFEHIEDHSVSMIVHALNKAKTLQELWGSDQLQYMSYLNPEINSFTLKSKILNSLFAIDTESYEKRPGKSLVLNYVSGTQVADGVEGANTTSLDIYSKFLQEMHMMLKGGLQEFMRHASKSSSFGVRVEGDIVGGMEKGDDTHLYLDVDMFTPNGIAEQYAVDEFFIDYIDAELGRIQRFNSDVDLYKTYAGYNRVLEYDSEGNPKLYAGQVFTAFDNVLTETTKSEILANVTDGSLKEYLETNPELREKIANEVKNYFDAQAIKNEKYLTEVDYIDPKLLKRLTGLGMNKTEAVSALVKAFTYNSWIHNFETANLMYGDMVQYNHAKEEMHKRNTGSTSGGQGFLTDVDAQAYINSFAKNTSYAEQLRKLPEFANETKLWSEYRGTFNTAILRDIVRNSKYIDQIRDGLTKDYTRKLSKSFSGDALTAEVNRRVEIEVGKYKGMEETDAQGWMTFDAYRNLKMLENSWTDTQEALFQKIIQNKPVSPSEITEFFPPYKLQHFGHLAYTELPVNAMHKFALMPLIPSMIKGSDLESLHHQMMKAGIQYATFQTASKVGSETKDGLADKIYEDDEQKSIKKNIEFTPNIIYLEYLKNVTAVPNKFKGKTVFSTQLRKLILEGLYEQGLINNPDVMDKVKDYEDTVDAYTDILKTQLLEEIGYELKDGKYVGNLGDFLKVVRDELGRRAIPEHHIKFVNVNENNTLKTDLSLHLEADEIEKILVSLIEKRLVKQKVKGEALVQVSSGMTNGMWNQGSKFTGATEDEVKKFKGTNNLPFYNTETVDLDAKYKGLSKNELKSRLDAMKRVKTENFTPTNKYIFTVERDYLEAVVNGKKPEVTTFEKPTSAMKVAIAMQGDFQNLFKLKHPDKKLIEVKNDDGSVNFDASLARLNEAIKDDEWLDTGNNRKSVTMTSVRIPVQGLNSMEFMEVHHFLHPSAGNIIIPPSEIVAKSGSDFDVDKLTTFMPSIDTDGQFRVSLEEFDNEALKRVINGIKKSGGKDARAQVLRLIEDKKKILENKLITSIRGILELPDNYANLVRPNETYLLKDIADSLESDVVDYNKFGNEHGEDTRTIIDKKGKAKKVISPTRVLEIGYNLHKHDVNMVGKAGLGIVAIENSLSPIFNALGAKMPKTYKPVYFDENSQRYVEDKYGDDMDMRLRLNHNKTSEGNISLSNILNVEGDSIADLYSQMMNGLVDVEKDAWIFFIQGNTEVIPVLAYLLKAGVPKNEAINFVSQPLVREYVKQQKILGSVYGKLSGQSPESPSYIKYEASNKAIDNLVPKDVLDSVYKKLNEANIKNVKDILVWNTKYQYKFKGTDSTGATKEFTKVLTGKEIIDGLNKVLKPGDRGIDHITAIKEYNPDKQKYDVIYAPAQSLVTNKNYYTAATVANTGSFDTADMRKKLKAGQEIDEKSLDMFLHFIEIEKQIKGIQALKRQSNPDTKTSKTIQEIIERTVALEDLSDLSKIDPDLIEKLKNESILNSFFDNQVVLDLIQPLFKLRNNPRINQYVSYAISAHASKITGKYGKGQEGVRQFINEYKNAVVNYIFQNYMSNIVNAQGKVVNIPDVYRGAEVIQTNAELKNGIEFREGTFYINRTELEKQFAGKFYLDNSPSPDAYSKKGLKPFKVQDDPFNTFASYLRYTMEREFIMNKFPKDKMKAGKGWLKSRDYATFLNQRALINSFNQNAIIGTEEYSFTKLVQSVIDDYPQLKDKYPILLQLSEANSRGPEKILTLSNKGLAKGDLAEAYNLNLSDLADANVMKLSNNDVEANNYISEVFKILPIMSIYQNGVGYSKYGINKVLSYDQFLSVIENASINFTNQNLNINTFDNIFENLFKGKDYFKNYVQDPENYNSFTNTSRIAKEEILSVPILEIDIPSITVTETAPGVGTLDFNTLENEVEPKGMVRNRLLDVLDEAPTEEFMMKLYQNYVNLMGRNKERAEDALSYKNFVSYVSNVNVIKYKDTYIFGVYEPKLNVFITKVSSSPTSKQLLAEAIPYISKQFDVVGFAPKDVVEKYQKSGYQVSKASYRTTFRNRPMIKYMYASNPGVSMRLFGKPLEDVTKEEIKNVDQTRLAIHAYMQLKNEILSKQDNADMAILKDALDDLRVPSHIIYNVTRNYKDWLNQSKEKEEEAIKRMEAEGIEVTDETPIDRKIKKKSLEKNLAKLYDFKKVDIDPIDTNLLNRTVPETENQLNQLLVNYLASFGVKFEYTDIKEKLGMDSLAVADIMNKIAYVQKGNTEDLPNVAGKFIAYMMQHNPLVTETYEALRKYSRYKSSSKDEILDVIGELISEQLHNKTNTEMPQSLIDKIKILIDYFFNLINEIRMKRINRNIGIITDGVLARNKAMITASKYKPGAEGKMVIPVDLQTALDSDPFASAVVDKMSEYFILTGSTTLAEQGSVLRPNENQVHDLDWVSTLKREKGKQIFEDMYPNSVYVREIVNEEDDYTTDTWLLAPEGYKLQNVKFQGKNNKVIGYDIVNSEGKVVSQYIPESDSHTGDVEAKAIDIFSYGNVTLERTANRPMELKSGITLRIADWRNTLAAKINFGRLKDVWDYNRFIPEEYIETGEPDLSENFIDLGEFKKLSKEDGTEADRKMRNLADGALVESVESVSSSQTTLRVVQKKIKDKMPEDLKDNVVIQIKSRARLVAPMSHIESPTIMLARNYSLRNKELDAPVKQALDVFINKKAHFIFGNSSTDRPFLEYLMSKNYNNFTIYGYTSKSNDNRITPEELRPKNLDIQEATRFQKSDEDILNSAEFGKFFNQEILKNPDLSVEEVLDYYKKCKLG
jgi:hypothetical protein